MRRFRGVSPHDSYEGVKGGKGKGNFLIGEGIRKFKSRSSLKKNRLKLNPDSRIYPKNPNKEAGWIPSAMRILKQTESPVGSKG